MTIITTKTFQQLVQDEITQWAASTNTNPVLASGDPLLAIFQSFASQSTFLEGLATNLANFGRAQTSTGANLDSWMSQFGFVRLPALPAQGTVTISASTAPTSPITIPAGVTIQTPGGAIQYVLIADTTQTAWSPSANAYILPSGQTSINATAQATVAGTVDNVLANQLTQLVSSIPGISTVTNQSAINNGANAETDTAFFARWLTFLGSLSKATLTAITAAINSVQTNLDFQVLNNTTQTGSTQYGFFTVVLENGRLPPSTNLLNNVTAAVAQVVAFTIQFTVVAPSIQTITVAMNIRPSSLETAVQTALVNYVNNLPIGADVFISSLVNTALSVAGVTSVQSGTTINSSTSDFIVTNLQVARTVTGNVTVGTY